MRSWAELLDAVKDSTLPIRSIQEIKEEVEGIIGGKPESPGREAEASVSGQEGAT